MSLDTPTPSPNDTIPVEVEEELQSADTPSTKSLMTFQSLRDTFVLIEVADGSRVVHKDVLCGKCKFFSKAFKGGFEEAWKQSIVLDVGLVTFNRFLDWLYFDRLPTLSGETFKDRDQEISMLSLVELYTFADKYDVQEIKDHLVYITHKYFLDNPTHLCWDKEVYEIYTNLPPSDPLCRVLVHNFALRFDSKYASIEESPPVAIPSAFWKAVAGIKGDLMRKNMGPPTSMRPLKDFLENTTLGAS